MKIFRISDESGDKLTIYDMTYRTGNKSASEYYVLNLMIYFLVCKYVNLYFCYM